MMKLGDKMDHYWRIIDMANAVGADPVAAMDKGVLAGHEWANMVSVCQSCDWAEGCKHFLAGPEEQKAIPDECLNASAFKRIQAPRPNK